MNLWGSTSGLGTEASAYTGAGRRQAGLATRCSSTTRSRGHGPCPPCRGNELYGPRVVLTLPEVELVVIDPFLVSDVQFQFSFPLASSPTQRHARSVPALLTKTLRRPGLGVVELDRPFGGRRTLESSGHDERCSLGGHDLRALDAVEGSGQRPLDGAAELERRRARRSRRGGGNDTHGQREESRRDRDRSSEDPTLTMARGAGERRSWSRARGTWASSWSAKILSRGDPQLPEEPSVNPSNPVAR